jgi:hypothetical protein
MVPDAFIPYLTAIATAAAALIGLLFIAVSLRDESIFGKDARPGGEALAVTAFSGLVNSVTVALLGLIPDANIGVAAIVLAVLSLYAAVRLNSRLHTARSTAFLVLTLLAYAAQLSFGIVLLISPHDSAAVKNLCYILFTTLVVALARAWSLLRGRHLTSAPGAGQSQT